VTRRPRAATSLTARLVVTFLVISVLMVVVVGLVAFRRARTALEAGVFDRLSAVADARSASLDQWIAEQQRNLVFIGTLPDVADEGLVLFDPHTSPAARSRAHDRLVAQLTAVVRRTSDAQELMVLDMRGTVAVSTLASDEGHSQANEPFFRQGRSHTTVQNEYTSTLSGQTTITVSTPLYDKGGFGQQVGVLAANLDLGRIDQIVLTRTGLGATGLSYLVGPDHRFVHAVLRTGAYAGSVHSLGIDRALAGASGEALYTNYAGVPVVGVYRWLPDHAAALLVEMDQAEAFAPARRLAFTIMGIGLLVVGLLGVVIFLAARRIARPILAITETAIAVTEGDLTREAPVISDDEVGTLARAFNEMTNRLRGTLEELRASQRRLVAAQDEERRRLERNIHDGAQQQLVALAVKMRLAQSTATRDGEKTAELLGQLQEDAQAALADLRDLAHGIYPPVLADRGLAAALEAQARRSALPVQVESDGISRYAPEIEAAIYFSVLEALQNVAKYANASRASVRLGQEEGCVTFTVEDDGQGFDPATTTLGSGVQGMTDRLAALDGTFEIRSRPAGGTVVTGRIPVQPHVGP
jgi:signal transduction histidine kinase